MNAHAGTAVVERNVTPIAEIRVQLQNMEGQFKAGLPAHIPAERFMRVVMTAIQNNNDLLNVSRRSLWNAVMKAAQDGLLPDGREGAIVPYKGEAQWMPMIAGIRKKVRNSGEIATWDVHAVHQNDAFEFELGDDPFIRHRPSLTERGEIIAVYSIATFKTGEKSRDVMSIGDVEKIRAKSRAKNGPWSDPTFYPEMAKKTVARRHSKVLPLSTDLDDLIRRDDELYDMKGAREEANAAADAAGRPRSLGARLDVLSALPASALEQAEAAGAADETPEEPDEPGTANGREDAEADTRQSEPTNGDAGDALNVAFRKGREAQMQGVARKALPGEYRDADREDEADAWRKGWDASANVDAEG